MTADGIIRAVNSVWESCNLRGSLWPLGCIHRWYVPWDTPLQSVGWHRQQAESTFHPIFFGQKPAMQEKATPHSTWNMNLVLCWEVLALLTDNLLWYLCLIVAGCNISKLFVLQAVWSGTNGPHCDLALPKQQPELIDWLLVLKLITAAHITSAAGGIKKLLFPLCYTVKFQTQNFLAFASEEQVGKLICSVCSGLNTETSVKLSPIASWLH